MPRLQHGQPRRNVISGDLQRFGHGSHAVVDTNIGVPQRIPQHLGDPTHHIGRHVVVQQHQVEIRVRDQLSAAQPSGGHDREATGGRDADLGGLCGEPELVQVDQRVSQRGRIQLA